MKKLILIAIALIGLQVVAQGPRGNREDFKNLTAEEIATKRTEKMTADLGLDAKQEKAVHAMNLEDSKKLKARERPSEEEREKMRAERKKHQEAANAKLKEILTDEQYAKLETSKEKGGRGKRGGKKKEGA